jgi:hypothetical protein
MGRHKNPRGNPQWLQKSKVVSPAKPPVKALKIREVAHIVDKNSRTIMKMSQLLVNLILHLPFNI